MNKLIMILSTFLLGGLLMAGNTENMDEYYNNLDTISPSIAAHKKMSKYDDRKGLLRKRAYKRKRTRRPPQRGK